MFTIGNTIGYDGRVAMRLSTATSIAMPCEEKKRNIFASLIST